MASYSSLAVPFVGSHKAMDSNWQDLPAELLVQILSLVDHRTVIIACGVCTWWREAMSLGITKLSFNWCERNITQLVRSIVPKFSKLQVCELWNFGHYLRDEAVEALAMHCHDLRELDLSKGTLITDKSLEALSHGCTMLEKLNLSGCTNVTEKGVIYLAEQCHFLSNLNLCGCSKAATDQALMALARNCMSLEVLNLGWCVNVTDVGIISLASWCRELKSIDLCGCFWITDQSVLALADKCHHLCSLGLYQCVAITDTAMYALANSSKYRNSEAIKKRRRQENMSFVMEGSISGDSSGSLGGSTLNSSSSSSSSCQNDDGSTIPSQNENRSTITSYHDSRRLQRFEEGFGLSSLNLGMCCRLSAQAVQAVCDAFPDLHTCAHSLNISACTNLISVHCACGRKGARKQRT